MNDVEDRLRDAYRAAGETVRPETIRGLHVARARPERSRFRGMSLLVPLGSAAAVAALVLVVSVIVPKGHGTAGSVGTAAKAGGGRAHTATAAPLPEFIVSADGSSLDVIRTATGQAAGHVAAPAGQSFTFVAGTADDRTFLVTAELNPQTACEALLYKVRLGDSGQPSAPVPLATSSLSGVRPSAVAMSADGRTAALSTVRCAASIAGNAGNTPGIGGIYLVDLATGKATRQWTYALDDDYTHDMTFSSDGSRLTLTMLLGNTERTGTLLMTTSSASGTLDSVSHVVLQRRNPQGIEAAELTPDGSTLYACTTVSSGNLETTTTLAAYSVASGQRTRVLRTWPPSQAMDCGLTMDPSGRSLLVSISDTADGKLFRPKTTNPKSHVNPVTTKLFAVSLATGGFTALPIQSQGPAFQEGFAW